MRQSRNAVHHGKRTLAPKFPVQSTLTDPAKDTTNVECHCMDSRTKTDVACSLELWLFEIVCCEIVCYVQWCRAVA